MRGAARQGGQVIILAALAIVVLIGVLGLAFDGGRAYVDRRSQQASVDAAALAAANDYMTRSPSDTSLSNLAGIGLFALNQRLAAPSSCTSGSPTCSYGAAPDPSVVITANDHGIAGMEFTATSTHLLPTTMMAVLGIRSMTVTATATAVARRHGTNGAAILTLSPDNCNGGGGGNSSLTFSGNSTSILAGDIWSNGSINVNGNYNAYVAGNVVDVCPPTPPALRGMTLCTDAGAAASPPCPGYGPASEVNGWAQPDPKYPAPVLDPSVRSWTRSGVMLEPGTYSTVAPNLQGCYFLAGGVYSWPAGFGINAGFVSNQLRPPDEASIGDAATRAPNQFWDTNGVHCAGAFKPFAVTDTATPVAPGTYAVRLTAARYEPSGCSTVGGGCYLRESVPSVCRTVNIGANQSLQVWVSNVPGAQFYDVYVSAAGGGCSGPFGLAGSVVNGVAEQWTSNDTCPSALPPPSPGTCGLGTVSGTITGTKLPAGWTPSSAAAPPDPPSAVIGSGLPNGDPAAGVPPHGDRANENYCASTSSGLQVSCPAAGFPAGVTTPGAVELFIPGGSNNAVCFNLQGGADIYAFSGLQYRRVLLFEPGAYQAPPPNTCPNNVNGHGFTNLKGLFYLPAASVTITGNSGYAATISGGVIAWTATINGNGQVAITADPSVRLWPSAVRLTR